MNDIEKQQTPRMPARRQKEEPSIAPPTEAEFERFADMMTRDLRRAQTEEITQTAKAHFHSDNPDAGNAGHDRKGTELLEDLGRKHTREQFTFRSSIGKLRTYYANAREREAAGDLSRSTAGVNKAQEPELSR